MIDPKQARSIMRAYAESQGIDFDALLADVSRHFQSPEIKRRTEPLTQKELDALWAEEEVISRGGAAITATRIKLTPSAKLALSGQWECKSPSPSTAKSDTRTSPSAP